MLHSHSDLKMKKLRDSSVWLSWWRECLQVSHFRAEGDSTTAIWWLTKGEQKDKHNMGEMADTYSLYDEKVWTRVNCERDKRREIKHSDSVSDTFSCMTQVAEAAWKHEKWMALNASDTYFNSMSLQKVENVDYNAAVCRCVSVCVFPAPLVWERNSPQAGLWTFEQKHQPQQKCWFSPRPTQENTC